jgi:hypothetical protein
MTEQLATRKPEYTYAWAEVSLAESDAGNMRRPAQAPVPGRLGLGAGPSSLTR